MWSWGRVSLLAVFAVGGGTLGGVSMGLMGAFSNFGLGALDPSLILSTVVVAGYFGAVYGAGGLVSAVLATAAVAVADRKMQRPAGLRAAVAGAAAALGMVGFFLIAFSHEGVSYNPLTPVIIGLVVGISAFASVLICANLPARVTTGPPNY